jgi:hypothetical protein
MSSKKTLIITLSVLISLLLGGTFYFISQNKSGQSVASNSTSITSSSTNSNSLFSSVLSQSSQNSSSLISQPTSSNPKIQPLVVDETHDVVVLDECDLEVKFNKKYKTSYKEKGDIFTIHDEKTIASYTIKKCTKAKPKEFVEREKYDKKDRNSPGPRLVERSEKGVSLEDEYASGFFDVEEFKLWTMGGAPAYNLYEIKSKNGFYYEINPSSQFEPKEDFQFQINSLAPSTPSVKL